MIALPQKKINILKYFQTFTKYFVIADLQLLIGVVREIQSNDKFYELHKRFARLTLYVAKGTVISYAGYSLLMVVVQPTIGSYFALGHLTPCMQVYFIGVREYSDFLMNVLIAYNLFMFGIMFTNYCAVDMLIYATLANIPLDLRF